ncbi:MAG: helix-turn-helix domain-containing protein, partial [Bacteroidota bacterium]
MEKEEKFLLVDEICQTETCPVITSLSIIGGKWKPAILYSLSKEEVLRFGKLKKKLAGITQKMLTQQLKELAADGIVKR